MYNLFIYYSAKDNTMSYLSDFDYKQKSSYKLEHLMMSEKQALPKAFAAEALSLDRESVGDLFDILVKRVVSHALVFRSDFENALTQQLQDKFFQIKIPKRKLEFNAFKTNELRRNNMSVLPRLVVIYSSYDLPAINEIACHLATLILSSLICYCK